MTPLACVGVILFAVLAVIVVAVVEVTRWLFGSSGGRPRS